MVIKYTAKFELYVSQICLNMCCQIPQFIPMLGCWVYSMDMMVLVDGSGSVRSEEFEKLLRFLKKIASHLDLKMHKVGVMQYSHFYFNR